MDGVPSPFNEYVNILLKRVTELKTMGIYHLQLLSCYVLVGLLMGWTLGFLPFWYSWRKKHLVLLIILTMTWLPVAIAALLVAPIFNTFYSEKRGEVK